MHVPYTEDQRKLFNAASHDPKIARANNMSQQEARKLADEANNLAQRGKEKASGFVDLSAVFKPQ